MERYLPRLLNRADDRRAREIRELQLRGNIFARRRNLLQVVLVHFVVWRVVIRLAGVIHAKRDFIFTRLRFRKQPPAGPHQIWFHSRTLFPHFTVAPTEFELRFCENIAPSDTRIQQTC